MKKTVLKFLLLGVFSLSLGFGFTGCDDYDDDIHDLRTEISDIRKSLTDANKELNDLKKDVEKALSDAQKALDEAQKALGEAGEAKDEAGKAGNEAAKAREEAAQALVEAEAARKAVAQAKIDLIETVEGMIEEALKGLPPPGAGGLTEEQVKALVNAELVPINAKLASLGAELPDLKGRIGALEGNDLNQAISLLEFQQSVLAAYGVTVSELDALIRGLKNGTTKHKDIKWDDVSRWVGKINSGLNVLSKAKLTTLVFRPAAYYDGQPAIVFTPITYKALTKAGDNEYTEGEKVTTVTNIPVAEYHMNSNLVPEESFVAKDMKFDLRVNVPAYTRATNPKLTVTPKYKGIDRMTGIMSVEVHADASYMDDGSQVDDPDLDYFDQVALQVPLAKANAGDDDEIVTSTYAVLHKRPAISEFGIAYVEDAEQLRSGGQSIMLPSTVDLVNPKLFKRTLSVELKIETPIVTVKNGRPGEPIDTAAYGFSLRSTPVGHITDEGELDPTNYVKIENGMLSPQVGLYEKPWDAIGKRPVIEILLMNGVEIVKAAYLSLEIVAEQVESMEVAFTPGAFKAACGDQTLNIGVKQMAAQIYTKLGMLQDEFHAMYTWKGAEPGNTNTGNVSETAGPGQSKDHILAWTVESADLWDTSKKNVAYTGRYEHNTLEETYVTVTLEASVTHPSLSVNNKDRIAKNWDTDDAFLQGVAVPEAGDSDPENCIFETNLYEGFVTYGPSATNGQKTGSIDWSKAATDYTAFKELYDGMEVDYYFDESNNKAFNICTLKVSNDADGGKNKVLKATKTSGDTQEVARIVKRGTGTTTNDPLKCVMIYADTEYAKELLSGNDFTVEIVSEAVACGKTLPIGGEKGQFNVKFKNPVKMALLPENKRGFWTDASSSDQRILVPVQKVISLTDWRGESFEKWEKGDEGHVNTNAHLYQYYGVELDQDKYPFVIGKATIRQKGTDEEKPLEGFVSLQDGDEGPLHFLYDKTGDPVTEIHVIKFPVSVTHKWGTTSVEVEIELRPL